MCLKSNHAYEDGNGGVVTDGLRMLMKMKHQNKNNRKYRNNYKK